MKYIKHTLLIILFAVSACSDSTDPKLLFKSGKYEKSFEIWLPLAEQGDVEAQNYIGIHYFFGLGVSRNINEAFKWYEKAAHAGFPDAQRNLGDMFHYGNGAPQNYYKAFIWYFAASQQGHETAMRSLESITGKNQLTPNQQMHAKIDANSFISDPNLRFQSHDTYIKK